MISLFVLLNLFWLRKMSLLVISGQNLIFPICTLSAEFRKGAPPPRSCTNFLTPWLILFDDYQIPGVTTFFAYRSTRFFLQLKKQVKYYQKQWYLGFTSVILTIQNSSFLKTCSNLDDI